MENVLELREPWSAGMDLPELRQAFGRLMDQAAQAVFLDGHDLDDCVCERMVEVGLMGAQTTRMVECPLADVASLERAIRAGLGIREPSAEIEIRGLRLRVTVRATGDL